MQDCLLAVVIAVCRFCNVCAVMSVLCLNIASVVALYRSVILYVILIGAHGRVLVAKSRSIIATEIMY